MDYFPNNITTILTQYRSDESIVSEIVLTVLQNVSMNGTLLECKSEDLASESNVIYVNISCKSLNHNIPLLCGEMLHFT